MSREGLVKTKRDPDDRRLVNVTLTSKGRELMSKATPVVEEIIAQVMSSISEDNVAILEEPLRIIRQNTQYGLEGFANHSQLPAKKL